MQSRNFGLGGLGTVQSGFATKAIYGYDVDFLAWDSGKHKRMGGKVLSKKSIFPQKNISTHKSLNHLGILKTRLNFTA